MPAALQSRIATGTHRRRSSDVVFVGRAAVLRQVKVADAETAAALVLAACHSLAGAQARTPCVPCRKAMQCSHHAQVQVDGKLTGDPIEASSSLPPCCAPTRSAARLLLFRVLAGHSIRRPGN